MKGISIILLCSLSVNTLCVIYFAYKYYLRSSIDSTWQQNTIENSYWQDKVAFFERLNTHKKGGVFLVGDSMFDRLHLEEFFSDVDVRNRGIGYDNSRALFQRVEQSVLSGQPQKIILFIGGNDISKRDDVHAVIIDTEKIIDRILSQGIEMCFVSILPKGENYNPSQRSSADINRDTFSFNKIMKQKCIDKGIVFVDITKHFVNDNFFLEQHFTSDDIHLNAQGMELLAELLEPYIRP